MFLPKEFHGQRSLAGYVVHEVAKSWTQGSEYHSLRQREGKEIQKENGVDGSSVHGILQERILEWVAILSPGILPNPGIEPRSSALRADTLTSEPPGKPKNNVCVGFFVLKGITLLGVCDVCEPCLPWLSGKESACSVDVAGATGSIPGLGRSRGEGNGNPPQYPCLKNPMGRGAWWGHRGVGQQQQWQILE